MRHRDADAVRVLFEHGELQQAGLLHHVCCPVCVGIGLCHQLQQDLPAQGDRAVSALAGRGTTCAQGRTCAERGGSRAGLRRTTSILLLQDSGYGSCSTGDTDGVNESPLQFGIQIATTD